MTTLQQSFGAADEGVVVIGAGLAGSAAAAFLGHAGVPTVVLERHRRPTARPRAWVLSARSQELFRELGLDGTIRTLGSPGTWDLQTVDALCDVPTAETVGEIGVEESTDVSPTGAAMCDQDVIEDVLRAYATEHGARFHWGRTVTDVVDRGDGVEIHRADGPPVRARHAILAEGARAGLLARIGVSSTRPVPDTFDRFDQVLFRSADLDRLMAHRPGKAFFCPPTGTIVFRRDLGRWQVQRQGRTFDDVEADIAAAVGRRVDVEVLDHSGWQPSARLADTFRAGATFLVGDAAHAMPPSLGMAGNLAVADAHNLAWKLAWVLSGRAGAGLLDSYQQERRPVGELVLDQSLLRTRQAETLDLATVQLGLGYPAGTSSALVGDGADPVVTDPHDLRPTVGARVPHQWLADGRTTLDLADVDTFVAIGAAPTASPIPFHPVPVGPTGVADADRVWIVRPDGHVAAHVPATRIDATLGTILDRAAAA